MTLHEALMDGDPSLPAATASEGTQYVAIDWLPEKGFAEASERGSLCCTLLLGSGDPT
jgi:hypothetical protein